VVCFGKLSLSDIPISNNQTPSTKWQRASWWTATPYHNK